MTDTTETTRQTLRVLKGRQAEACRALDKAAKKARRYGNPDIRWTVGETVTDYQLQKLEDGTYRRVKVQLVELHVDGDAPRVGPYEFLARVELAAQGNMIDTVPGTEGLDPRFRTTTGSCDHCKHNRRRKEVFVVRHRETGDQLQIGRQCLRDYLGIDSPSRIVNRFSFIRDVQGISDGYGSLAIVQVDSLDELLTWAAVAVRLFGWCSSGQAQIDDTLTPTVSYVRLAMNPRNRTDKYNAETYRRMHDAHSQADADQAAACIAWVRDDLAQRDGLSDYEHNLATIMAEDVIYDPKRTGLVVSALQAHARHLERELRRTKEREAAKVSRHVGEIGERLRGVAVVKTMGRTIGGNRFGDLNLFKFVDEAGNVFTWFTGGSPELADGERTVIDGTVKAHKDFNGAAETQLTRVTVH